VVDPFAQPLLYSRVYTRTNKNQLIALVRIIAGQIAAIERALETEAECSVLQQVAGARGAITVLLWTKSSKLQMSVENAM
jgi:hypothetical protein